MLEAAGITSQLPAGAGAEGVLCVLFFAAIGLVLLSAAKMTLKKSRAGRHHHGRYTRIRW